MWSSLVNTHRAKTEKKREKENLDVPIIKQAWRFIWNMSAASTMVSEHLILSANCSLCIFWSTYHVSWLIMQRVSSLLSMLWAGLLQQRNSKWPADESIRNGMIKCLGWVESFPRGKGWWIAANRSSLIAPMTIASTASNESFCNTCNNTNKSTLINYIFR